jgi:hypothetical protein
MAKPFFRPFFKKWLSASKRNKMKLSRTKQAGSECTLSKPLFCPNYGESLIQGFTPPPATTFHVAGYKAQEPSSDQQVWVVEVAKGSAQRINPPGQQGASWGGEADILSRLVQPVGQLDSTGKVVVQFPVHPIPWGFFTLQDAIDFAIFAVRSTIDAIRFQPRAKTVGGPIDVLVIKPTEAIWAQRKALRATTG